MRFSRSIPFVAAAAVVTGLLTAGTASADTGTSVVLGPVPLPSVPAQVCVTQTPVGPPGGLVPGLLSGLGLGGATPPVNRCVSTPAGGTISMQVDLAAVTPTVAVTPPTVTQVPCPAGTNGIAGRINSGSADVTAAATVTVTLPTGQKATIPVASGPVPAGKSLTLYGCTGLS